MSQEEKQLYDLILRQSQREIDDIVSKGKSVKKYNVLLNLTAANYVHIVEPQWNPSVEEQAVARALRMGQTRHVTIIRYVVQGSVEQNILHLQKKKKSAAKFVFNLDTAEELHGNLAVRYVQVNGSDKPLTRT
ncbi:DNA repair protein RAD5 [Colletotrichum viniferum]|nr:DNA repair protein RAD5 [Colletotrichum viniferum]